MKKTITGLQFRSGFLRESSSRLHALIALLIGLGFSTPCSMLLGPCSSAHAQQPKKIFRIGYLASIGSAPPEAFRQGLRDLDYIEGKNIAFEFRASGGKRERNAELAAEVVGLRVDVIVAAGAGAIRAAKKATATIPIVMSEVNDPVALGFVISLAHPGGNITGVSNLSP